MGGKGSVYRRGATWTAHLTWGTGPRQQQIKKGGFRTRREAEAELVRLAATVQDGRWVPAAKRTVGSWLTDWLDNLVVAGRRETTIHSYRRLVETHVRPAIGEISLADLSAVDVDRLYSTMASKGLKPRTIRFCHSVLRKSLADAEAKMIVSYNVADKASPPRSSATRAPEAPVWTPGQLRTFLEQTKDHHHGALIRLAAMTGMRRGELCGLRWSDVDLDAGTLAVRQTITSVKGVPVVGDVKTATSRRVIDLDPQTVTTLRRYRTAQMEWRLLAGPRWIDSGLVFTVPDGSGWNPDTITQAVERLAVASGLPRLTLHGLRHTHTTHLLASGVNPRLVSARLGHASVAFTLDRYAHVMPGQQAAAAAAVAALVDGQGGQR
jgi:integrase